MKKRIKEYWNQLKSEYEEKYREPILKDYDQTKPYFERFRIFLKELFSSDPRNVDTVCMLASVEMELRNDEVAIALLEDFISRYRDELSNPEKARIATNLGFYREGNEKGLEYLLDAEKLDSPFVETYKGLALHSFSSFQSSQSPEDLQKSLKAFQKGLKLGDNYEMQFGYGVCLFASKEYGKAKEIFESLLSAYPNRMRLLLGIAYCEAYLGNKEKALFLLQQVSVGQDSNYSLHTDEIDELEIFDGYYMLEEYDLFLEEANKVISEYYFADWDYYFYSLWIKNQQEKFDLNIEKYKKELLEWIEETRLDEDFSNEAEREEYIKSYQNDLQRLITMENKIKHENYKPVISLKLYPEYGCFLVDCIRHKTVHFIA